MLSYYVHTSLKLLRQCISDFSLVSFFALMSDQLESESVVVDQWYWVRGLSIIQVGMMSGLRDWSCVWETGSILMTHCPSLWATGRTVKFNR